MVINSLPSYLHHTLPLQLSVYTLLPGRGEKTMAEEGELALLTSILSLPTHTNLGLKQISSP